MHVHLSDRLRRRGAVLVMTAAILVLILMFAALAIDVGYICVVAGDMQHSADGSALAGASALHALQPDSVSTWAMDILDRMHGYQGFSAPAAQRIETGIWNSTTMTFETLEESGASKAFAVRVVSHRPETQYFFAGVMGKYSTDVAREAVAVGSSPCNGVWGLNGVSAGSIQTDSYDSTVGPYDDLIAGDNGDVCSGKDITIRGSKEIDGDVQPGFGYDLTVKGGAGFITGITTPNSGAIPVLPVDLGDSPTVNDNDLLPSVTEDGIKWYKKDIYELDMQGQYNLTMPAGTYYFDSIKLAGGASVTVTGPTTIYVAGDVDATGGAFVNETQDPNNLTIISMGTNFKMGGNVDLYGTILAPNATATLTGNTLYGVIIAGYLELKGDLNVHVDESLPYANFMSPPEPMLVK